MNAISHLDPILPCVGWGCKKSRFLATWCIQFWSVILFSVHDTGSWLVSLTCECIFICIFHVRRKLWTYFIELSSLYKRGRKGGSTYMLNLNTLDFFIFAHFRTHEHLTSIVCAPLSAPLFYNEQSVKIWGLRSHRNVKWMSYLI